MKLAAMIAITVMVGASAQGKAGTGRQVTVYCRGNAIVPVTVMAPAKSLAADMFANIGVTLQWRSGKPSQSEADAIVIEFVTGAPAAFKPGVLASALPYEGVHIRIFWDRIAAYPCARKLLAHVIVHEITHILQGFAQHSDEGIMKAHWTGYDRSSMIAKPLRFTPADVTVIYMGMDARCAHPSRAESNDLEGAKLQ